jgi:hypothetical protein
MPPLITKKLARRIKYHARSMGDPRPMTDHCRLLAVIRELGEYNGMRHIISGSLMSLISNQFALLSYRQKLIVVCVPLSSLVQESTRRIMETGLILLPPDFLLLPWTWSVCLRI